MIVFKPHSFIDVITNSSTELFVGDQAKGIEFVKEALVELLRQDDEKRNSTHPTKFESVFGSVRVLTESDVMEFIDQIVGYKDGYDPFFTKVESYPPHPEYNFRDTIDQRREKWAQHDADVDAWKERNRAQLMRNCVGSIVIEGASDNSIPYDLFDSIENLFDVAQRYHLG